MISLLCLPFEECHKVDRMYTLACQKASNPDAIELVLGYVPHDSDVDAYGKFIRSFAENTGHRHMTTVMLDPAWDHAHKIKELTFYAKGPIYLVIEADCNHFETGWDVLTSAEIEFSLGAL